MTDEPEHAVTPQHLDVPGWGRVAFFLAAAWFAGFIAWAIVALGLDYAMDCIIDFFLLEHISNGDLRLAGISAPLSEEPARLIGILASVAGMVWWMRRKGLHPDSLRLGGRVPWPWVFGMNAGLAFAIMETLGNGDQLIAILSRAMSHGTYASLIVLALVWRRDHGTTWPVVVALTLAMAMHGVGNALRAVDQGAVGVRLLVYGFFVVLAVAVLAARLKPETFGTWAFDTRRPQAAEV